MTIRHDLTVQENVDFSWTYTHKDSSGTAIDLTGYSAAMSIKRVPGQTNSPRAYLSSGSDADGGTLTLGGVAGTILIEMTAAQTYKLTSDVDFWALSPKWASKGIPKEVHLLYDLLLTDGSGVVTKPLEGALIVERSVTP